MAGSGFADLLEIVLLSLRVSGTAVVISAALGIPIGAWLGMENTKARRILLLLVNTGMALPPVVVGLVLYILLSRTGPLWFLRWLFSPSAMIAAQTILAFPFVVGITAAAVAALPGELFAQVRSLGATVSQARLTLLREAKDGVLVAVAAAFGRSISEVGAVLIVGGNIEHHTRVLTTAIVLETGRGNFHYALALGVVLLTIALGVNFAILRLRGGRPVA